MCPAGLFRRRRDLCGQRTKARVFRSLRAPSRFGACVAVCACVCSRGLSSLPLLCKFKACSPAGTPMSLRGSRPGYHTQAGKLDRYDMICTERVQFYNFRNERRPRVQSSSSQGIMIHYKLPLPDSGLLELESKVYGVFPNNTIYLWLELVTPYTFGWSWCSAQL